MKIFTFLSVLLVFAVTASNAQQPSISYSGHTFTYTVGTAITPLSLTNSGGPVPATAVGQIAILTTEQAIGTTADAAGNVYASIIGNMTDHGIIKKITPGGIETQIGGEYPLLGSIVSDPSGIIYASTTVFIDPEEQTGILKIMPDGTSTVISSGPWAEFSGQLALDSHGNLYYPNGTEIEKIDPTGTVTVFANTTGAFIKAKYIAADGADNIYVLDKAVSGKVYKITPAGVITVVVNLPNPVTASSITVDSHGNVYICSIGGPIIRYSPTGVATRITTHDILVEGMSVDPSGNLFVANSEGVDYYESFHNFAKAVKKITSTGYTISQDLPAGLTFDATTGMISGTPTTPTPAADYTVTAINLDGSSSYVIHIGVNGVSPSLSYSSPSYTFGTGSAITPLTPINSGGAVPPAIYNQVSTFAGEGVVGSRNGIGAVARFNVPSGVTTDKAGNIYIAEISNNRIRAITPGASVTEVAGGGKVGRTDGQGNAALFNGPAGISIDASSNLYIADTQNNLIREITPVATVVTFSGSGTAAFADGISPQASFNKLNSLKVDMQGNIYVADAVNNRIRKVATDGSVTNFAGSGGVGAANGSAASATFNNPTDVTIDPTGTIVYVADFGNNVIRKITGGVVSTFAGSGVAGSANGTGSAATFHGPAFLTTDINGNVYVSDQLNNIIRKITPAGVVTTLAGSPTNASGKADGIGTAATFNGQSGLAFNGSGDLFIADTKNNIIRKMSTTGFTISPATLPAGLVFDGKTGTISGTPTASAPATNYTITGYNTTGSSSVVVSIKTAVLTNANLSALALSAGTLAPVFDQGTTDYTAAVPNATTSIKITPAAAEAGATIKVNGTTVTTGTASASIPLTAGDNAIGTVVTAPDGTTTKTYTVTVTRAASSNAVLSALSISVGTLTPSFSPGIARYTASVANTVTSMKVTPTTIDATATVKVNGVAVASGTASGVVPLTVGSNVIITQITAQDGTSIRNYTVTVTRAPSTNAILANLVVNGATISPSFSPGIARYTASVDNSVPSVTISPTVIDATATIKVNGVSVTSGATSGPVALAVGTNTINTVTTAQDGVSQRTYSVTITRAAPPISNNAVLAHLVLNGGIMSPSFSPGIARYTSTVSNATTTVSVTPTTVEAHATIKVNGVPVASGAASQNVALSVGSNVITTQVTAQDGISIRTYTITVTRNAPSGMALAAELTDNSIAADGITVHQSISPNGDGNNDVLLIDGISAFPDNSLVIFDRSGGLVFNAKGYNNGTVVFDGHSSQNRRLQLPGTYFYSLDYKAGDIKKHKTGYILIKY